MKIHKEGIPVIILVFFLLSAIVILINILFPVQTLVHVVLYLSGAVFYFFVIRFFRDPLREVSSGE